MVVLGFSFWLYNARDYVREFASLKCEVRIYTKSMKICKEKLN